MVVSEHVHTVERTPAREQGFTLHHPIPTKASQTLSHPVTLLQATLDTAAQTSLRRPHPLSHPAHQALRCTALWHTRVRHSSLVFQPLEKLDSGGTSAPPRDRSLNCSLNLAEQKSGREGLRPKATTRENFLEGWFPSGVKYDEKCLQNLIKSLCSIPFNLIQSQCQKMHTKVFVKSASIAFELKKVNSMICNEDNGRVTKIKGYEVPQQALDHQRLHSDPHMSDSSNSRADVMTHDIEMGPNLRNCMAESLQIHEENAPKLLSFNSSNNTSYKLVGLPNTMQKAPNLKSLNLSKNEVKSEGELDKVKALESEEMCADRNPLCTTFPDKSTNIRTRSVETVPCSSTGAAWSQILVPWTDNHEVPLPIVFGIEASKKLPVCRVRRYYWVYDYGDRLGLLDAYHDEACFSLTLPFNPEDLIPSCLDKYSKGSRNIKKLKDPVLRVQLLKHTKHDIVDSLSVLPRTEHDISSLVVDMCVQTEKMLCFSVSGAFKEVEGMCQAHVRAFTRIFIATPSSNFSSLPTLSQQQQEMVAAFTAQSGMNLEWAQK
ncbi:nuclear RNA export factor 1-like [Loxodonta africana]|uniref:nuclear RNA export factor 1-like n=1 Tax=Loxodonta africana TaxID=9785 RepID=UPI0030CC9B9A